MTTPPGFITPTWVSTNKPIRIAVAHIVNYAELEGGTFVHEVGQAPKQVKETPEEIDALIAAAIGRSETWPCPDCEAVREIVKPQEREHIADAVVRCIDDANVAAAVDADDEPWQSWEHALRVPSQDLLEAAGQAYIDARQQAQGLGFLPVNNNGLNAMRYALIAAAEHIGPVVSKNCEKVDTSEFHSSAAEPPVIRQIRQRVVEGTTMARSTGYADPIYLPAILSAFDASASASAQPVAWESLVRESYREGWASGGFADDMWELSESKKRLASLRSTEQKPVAAPGTEIMEPYRDCDSCIVGAKCPYALPVLANCPQCGALNVNATMPDAFGEYFAKNYPGPNTIIANPHWHAPKIWRAAVHAMTTVRAVQAPAPGELQA